MKKEKLENTLQKIKERCKAYPVEVFPEPDFPKVVKVLEQNGMTLDAIAASIIRHVLKDILKIIENKGEIK